MTLASATRPDEDLLDVRALFASIGAKRWWIIVAVIVSTIGFVLVAFLTVPVFKATTVLVPADNSQTNSVLGSALGELGGLAALAGINIGGASETEETLAVLRSRQFTESFIAEKGLVGILLRDEPDRAETHQQAVTRAYRRFDDMRTVVFDKRSGLINLSVEWTDRNEAATWVNALVERLNNEMRQRATTKAEASLQFLEKELASTVNIASRDALSRLIEVQMKQKMLANVSHEYVVRVVDKALPPEDDEPIRPKKILLLALGPVVGLVMGILLVIFSTWWEPTLQSLRRDIPDDARI